MSAEKTNYDLLYNPRLVVKGFEEIFDRWDRDSQRARAGLDCYLDVPYGPGETEKMDIFRAHGEGRGLLMYIHGGYWRSLDKKRLSFVAPAFADARIPVAVPRYPPCPPVPVAHILMPIVQAFAWACRY